MAKVKKVARKGSPKKKADKSTPKGAKDKSGKRPVGKSSGLPILGTWAEIFKRNETVSAGSRLTDEQISARIKKEFPGRNTAAFGKVQYCRSRYNKGGFTAGKVPSRPSRPYDKAGKAMEVRRGRKATAAKKK